MLKVLNYECRNVRMEKYIYVIVKRLETKIPPNILA